MISSAKLSIVLQGAVNHNTIIDIANNCEIYKETFPGSEIICVFSSSDLFDYSEESETKLNKKYKEDYYVNASIRKINQVCDRVILCRNAIPLHGIKNDTGRFNGNHQIEAATLGLAAVTREYVLRTRNDIIFCSQKIFDFFEEFRFMERGNFSVFKSRVLISSAFTLNPFAMERFPFHWSDWFHLGLTSDVKLLWSAKQMSPKELLFFKYNEHPAGANEPERRFFSRIAVEQHINFNLFKKYFPHLQLKYINDCTSVMDSLVILRDNFIVCDPYQMDMVFDKYKDNATKRYQKKWLISHLLWRRMLKASMSEIKDILSFSREDIFFDRHENFPRKYRANDLYTKVGCHINERIVVNHPYEKGVLVYGPHTFLPSGLYKADCVFDSSVSHYGSIKISVTLEKGRITLFSNIFKIGDIGLGGESLNVSFEFANTFGLGCEFELVVEVEDIEDLSFSHIDLVRISDLPQRNVDTQVEVKHDLMYDQLPGYLRGILYFQSIFMNKRKKNKMHNNIRLFLEDSKFVWNKKILAKYRELDRL